MFLFFCLANATDKQAAISALAKVRVMKLYDPILEFITDWDANMPQHTLIEQHERFLDELKKRELIRPRVKWFD
jgi:hypothetical protein